MDGRSLLLFSMVFLTPNLKGTLSKSGQSSDQEVGLFTGLEAVKKWYRERHFPDFQRGLIVSPCTPILSSVSVWTLHDYNPHYGLMLGDD